MRVTKTELLAAVTQAARIAKRPSPKYEQALYIESRDGQLLISGAGAEVGQHGEPAIYVTRTIPAYDDAAAWGDDFRAISDKPVAFRRKINSMSQGKLAIAIGLDQGRGADELKIDDSESFSYGIPVHRSAGSAAWPPAVFPVITAPKTQIAAKFGYLREALKRVIEFVPEGAYAASRFAINSVKINAQDDGIRLVGTNGHKLAVYRFPCKINAGASSFLVDSRFVAEVIACDAKLDSNVDIQFGGNHGGKYYVSAAIGESIRITCETSDEQYPEYSRVIPRVSFDTHSIFKASRARLVRFLDAVMKFKDGYEDCIHIQLSPEGAEFQLISKKDGALRLRCRMEGFQDTGSEPLPLLDLHQKIRFGFSPELLFSVIRSGASKYCRLCLESPEKALVVYDDGKPETDYVRILMPIRIRS